MTYQDTSYVGLPDPEIDRQFYENVPSKRLVAWLIDSGITFAITILIAILTLGVALFIYPLLFLVVGFIYRTITIGNNSATWGMKVVGIEFRDKSGMKFTTSLAATHTALYTIFNAFFVLQIASMIMMLNTNYKQSLSDMMLGTTAINRPAE